MNDKPDDVDKTDDELADTPQEVPGEDAGDEISLVKDEASDGDDADDDDADVADDEGSEGDDDAADGPELVGATAGSARAAARRAGARTGHTEKKGRATRARDEAQVEKLGLFGRLVRFLRQVIDELRKVIWPARNQMVTYTIVVIVFVVFMVALVSGADVLFAQLMLAVFS